MSVSGAAQQDLLNAFREHYHRYEASVRSAVANSADTVVLWRLGDDLEEYANLLDEYAFIFDAAELELLCQNIAVMQNDVRQQYQDAADQSHEGRPIVVERVYSGAAGRPSIEIDPDFLRWAYSLRSTSSIAHFLGVSRTVVRQALLDHGIAEPQEQPAGLSTREERDGATNGEEQPAISSYTGPLSTITDDELDELVIRLRHHFRRAGVRMMQGMLRRLGHHVQIERIRQSLLRIDPVRRVFERITIRRRTYNVPGPNSLWHHDGQHGLIRWGIVIHGFIDGYSRLITGLLASNNNRSQTVLDLFLAATLIYGIPSRVRGDHGVENLLVAAWMEALRGEGRGSYLWGRSVHNVRIERLWGDITAQIGATWAELFTHLEIQHGLDINNVGHIWLLHYLFLNQINEQLRFFMESWNQHNIEMRRGPGPNRSPADMFGFDMIVHGVRGSELPTADAAPMSDEEMEVFGVDWEALRDNDILDSRQQNNAMDEEPTSWLGRRGPPENLNEIAVEPPTGPFSLDELQALEAVLLPFAGAVRDEDVVVLWIEGLAAARRLRNDLF
ncbi:hypothetical protein R3P38DRAFT_3441058 [Favolaschia claudopus]|uniref:Integrase catalytic domain-containing protein n=1 Tax=Favolaschia claudopus TaxID=2862362 RepID=A0AAW0CWR6_9AGAR